MSPLSILRGRLASRYPLAAVLAGLLVAGLALTGCAVPPADRSGGPLLACATINPWGSILSELAGPRVRTVSIIDNPATDPHDYEPTPADARLIARAAVFVENGVGYDSWAARAVRADPEPHRQLVDVGRVTGTPDGGNPHRWYSPSNVQTVAAAITAALQRADPANSDYYARRRQQFLTVGLAGYHQLIDQLRQRYPGVPVGASESIVAPLVTALGLNLVTPSSFLRAVSEGTEPSTADKRRIDSQLANHRLTVYLLNSQNAVPDVAEQAAAARRAGIPVVTVTETLAPAGASFASWQVDQLRRLSEALASARSAR